MKSRVAIVMLCLIGLADAVLAAPPKDQFPQEPGTHHLALDVEWKGNTRTHTYGLYLPPNFADLKEGEKLPMLVYLVGLGERGNEPRQLYMLGPLAEMERHAGLKKWVNFAILVVQCPHDTRYENPEMGNVVAQTTRHVVKHWPIDPNRVHLLGMSMGGEGVWHAALAGPGLYATVTALGGRAHPDPPAVAKALAGTTVWVVVGDRDGEFTAGSRTMVKALKEQNIDVVHTILPGFHHNIWQATMSKRQLYEWIMRHARGQEPPEDRPTGKQLVEIAFLPAENQRMEAFNKDVTESFAKWLPYWQIENCGRKGGVGYIDQFGLGKDVFLTYPLSPLTPCRLMTTWKIPEGKKTKLKLRVGCHPRGSWKLVVRLDNQVVLEKDIARNEQGEIYQSFEFDLTKYAGRELPIQLYNQATGWDREYAVWDDIEIVSE